MQGFGNGLLSHPYSRFRIQIVYNPNGLLDIFLIEWTSAYHQWCIPSPGPDNNFSSDSKKLRSKNFAFPNAQSEADWLCIAETIHPFWSRSVWLWTSHSLGPFTKTMIRWYFKIFMKNIINRKFYFGPEVFANPCMLLFFQSFSLAFWRLLHIHKLQMFLHQNKCTLISFSLKFFKYPRLGLYVLYYELVY